MREITNISESKLARRYCEENGIVDKEVMQLYVDAILEYFNRVKYEIIDGKIYKPNYNWGAIGMIRLRRSAKKKIDHGTSKKIGKIVYYTNEHTDGFSYSLRWGKKSDHIKVGFRHIGLYRMKAIRNYRSCCVAPEIFRRNSDPMIPNFTLPNTL